MRFRVLKSGRAPGNFRLPGLSIMAFTKENGKIILVREVKYQVVRWRKPGVSKSVLKEFVAVQLFNTNMFKSLAQGGLSTKDGSYKKYIKQALYEDAREALDVAGRYAAAQFGVSNIMIVSKGAVPGSRFGVRVPVSFERHGGKWNITNRPSK